MQYWQMNSMCCLTCPTGDGKGFLGSLRPLQARITVLWRCRWISASSWFHSLSWAGPFMSRPSNWICCTLNKKSIPVTNHFGSLCARKKIATWNPHSGQPEQKNNAVSYLPASSLSKYLAASLAPYTSACSTAMCLRRASFSFFSNFTSASNLASFTFSFLLASSSFSCEMWSNKDKRWAAERQNCGVLEVWPCMYTEVSRPSRVTSSLTALPTCCPRGQEAEDLRHHNDRKNYNITTVQMTQVRWDHQTNTLVKGIVHT